MPYSWKKGPYLILDTLNITCTVELCTMQTGTFVKKKDKRSAFWFLVDFKVICTYLAQDFIVWGLDLMTVLVYRVKSDLVSSTFYQNGCEEIDKCVTDQCETWRNHRGKQQSCVSMQLLTLLLLYLCFHFRPFSAFLCSKIYNTENLKSEILQFKIAIVYVNIFHIYYILKCN